MNEYLINCKLSLLLEDYFDALDHEVKRNVACPLVTDDPSKYSRRALSSYENESKIQITEFKCNNTTEEIFQPDLCKLQGGKVVVIGAAQSA
ncbi:hypothetical protein GLOIN_2v1886071 [Rhizophagus irregularis DAOM 181602=DAOM 197198]|nr:hypothetical protein GLOIN_2v1886071 [Rhizophagus irregularis DAOM 181602=DAOM 197198]